MACIYVGYVWRECGGGGSAGDGEGRMALIFLGGARREIISQTWGGATSEGRQEKQCTMDRQLKTRSEDRRSRWIRTARLCSHPT